MGLLDAVNAVGAHDEAVVDVARTSHLTTVVAGEADRQDVALASLLEGRQQVPRPAARGQAERDVAGSGVGDQLTREHQLEADVVAQRAEHGRVVGEAAGWKWLAPWRRREQDGDGGGVGRAAAVAEREEPPSRPESCRHGVRDRP